jgi:squalene-hopene/tetraprenyl-beta-curcumene cyclase
LSLEAQHVSDLALSAARPSPTSPRPETPSRLDAAVQAAQRYLLSLQREDGHWCGELEGDTILESEYILVMHFLGRGHDPKVRKAGNYLRASQRPQGGWSIYPGGPVEVSASVKAYFSLKLLGDQHDLPHMERARQRILEAGGLDACNSFTKIYLAIFGQYDWARCPSVPPELMLAPRWFPLSVYAMSSWSRGILVPLTIISARRPSHRVPDHAAISELRAPGFRPPRPMGWGAFFHRLDAAIKTLEALPWGGARRVAIARAERWTLEHLEDSHGIGAIFPPIVNTVYALRALGYPQDHPAIQSQLAELERLEIEEGDTLRLQPCLSPVWDTVHAINSLIDSGLPADHEAVRRAAMWVLGRRGHDRGDWTQTAPQIPHAGWYFEYANPFYPDCDTTSQSLTSLAKVDLGLTEEGGRAQRASFEALEWLLAMQSSDGGWAAFDRDCDQEILTQVPFADHNAMIDPSTVDVTARGLEALAEIGFDHTYPPAGRAVEFLRREQEPDGAWYGRWGCNYIYGTYLALWALRKIGADLTQPWVRAGVDWLCGHQNLDGGWGETLASYDDSSLRGQGPSTPSQTAWALLGLMAAGERDSDAVRRGIEFLLRRQAADGSWPEPEWTGTGFPQVFYLRYHLYSLYFPLLALGVFARSTGRHQRRARGATSGAA